MKIKTVNTGLTKEEQRKLRIIKLAGEVILKEDKKLFEELAKY